MTFKFWGGMEAETEFRDDFMTVHRNAGYTGCYSAAQTEVVWADVRRFASTSPTAMNLLSFIDQSETVIHVISMSGGFQCFGSRQGTDLKKGVIFVDLDAKLNILATTEHNLHLPIDVMAKLWKDSKGGKTRIDLDNRITLLHEIGHAKQWIERPGWFDDDFRTATKRGVGDDAPSLKDVSAREIREKAKVMHLKTAATSYPAGRRPDLSFLPADKRIDGDKKKPMQTLDGPLGWGVPIEHDNMRRHEWPICRELGLPLRSSYGDIGDGGSTKNQQLTSLMKKWIAEEDREYQAKNASRIAKPVESVCPVCGLTFPSNFKLGLHRMNGSCKS